MVLEELEVEEVCGWGLLGRRTKELIIPSQSKRNFISLADGLPSVDVVPNLHEKAFLMFDILKKLERCHSELSHTIGCGIRKNIVQKIFEVLGILDNQLAVGAKKNIIFGIRCEFAAVQVFGVDDSVVYDQRRGGLTLNAASSKLPEFATQKGLIILMKPGIPDGRQYRSLSTLGIAAKYKTQE